MPSAHAQFAANLTPTYYVDDLVRSISYNGATRTWARDSAGRLVGWTDADPANGPSHLNHYDSDGDNPSWTTETTDGTSWTRTISGIAGSMATQNVTPSATTIDFKLTNLHGDVAVTASSTATEPATPLNSFDATEFGAPRGGAGTSPRYGWLGGKQRSADTPSGVILMGVRLYLPTIGRFLQVDPIYGGNHTAYDYVGHDAVNGLDLDGKWGFKCKWCKKLKKNWRRYVHAAASGLNFAGSAIAFAGNFGCAWCLGVGLGLQGASVAAYALSGDHRSATKAYVGMGLSVIGASVARGVRGAGWAGRASRAALGTSIFAANRGMMGWNGADRYVRRRWHRYGRE